MGNTPDNFLSTAVAIGPGKLYVDVIGATLGAGGRLLLGTDGSPDSIQNPNAKHIGYTEAGVEMSLKSTITPFRADESNFPIVSRVTEETASISGSALQVMDFDIETYLNPLATRSNVSGTFGMTFGGNNSFNYVSVAVIFPLEGSPTLYGVFHLYKAVNNAGMAAKITSKSLGAIPFVFEGHAITTRAAGDQVGRMFKQLAAGS